MDTDTRKLRINRKLPETVQEHKDEAIRCLAMATHPAWEHNSERWMIRARRHVAAAELLARLADLHN